MRRLVLPLTIIYTAAAQMTFTDNWDKRTLPSLFRGWQPADLTTNEACNLDVIAEIIRELKQMYKKQNELINVIDRCSIIERPVFVKEGPLGLGNESLYIVISDYSSLIISKKKTVINNQTILLAGSCEAGRDASWRIGVRISVFCE